MLPKFVAQFYQTVRAKVNLAKAVILAVVSTGAAFAVVVAAAGNATCNNSNYIEHSCA